MTTSYKVTKLFCIIDEFCKHFNAENAGNLLEDNSGVKRRRRQASLSDSEIMTILLYFHFGTFRNFKHYYLFFIKGTMKSYFPKAVSYNRFVELESRVSFQLIPNWGVIVAPYVGAWIETIKAGDKGALLGCRSLRPDFINASP